MLTMYKFPSNHPLRRKTDYVIVLGKYCVAAIRMTVYFEPAAKVVLILLSMLLFYNWNNFMYVLFSSLEG